MLLPILKASDASEIDSAFGALVQLQGGALIGSVNRGRPRASLADPMPTKTLRDPALRPSPKGLLLLLKYLNAAAHPAYKKASDERYLCPLRRRARYRTRLGA